MTRRISYILPAHNQADVLAAQVARLRARLGPDFPGSEVLIVENGSTDRTPQVAAELVQDGDELVRVVALVSEKGLGNAMRAGVAGSTGDLVVISGGVSFGFTDLDGALALPFMPPLVIGSKAHRDSHVDRGLARRITTIGFKSLRRVLLGTHVGDSQGSFIVDGVLARQLFPLTQEPGFVAQTEFVALVELAGEPIVEVPVTLNNDQAPSSIHPVRTSLTMLEELIRLRRRYPEMRVRLAAAGVGRGAAHPDSTTETSLGA